MEFKSQQGQIREPVEVKFTWVPQEGQKGKRKVEELAEELAEVDIIGTNKEGQRE